MFSFEPQFLQHGLILDSASRASSLESIQNPNVNTTVVHAKLDATGYSYVNRSYGVGASVGLVDAFAQGANAYSYQEIGLDP